MAVPLYSKKIDSPEISSPSRWVDYMSEQGRLKSFSPPEIVFLTWQKSLFTKIKSRYAHRSCSGFPGDLILLDGTRSHEKGEVSPRIAVAGGFGIGAPAAVFMMELMIALGAKRFIGLGTAGGLGGESFPPLKAGDVILADRAFRDEGTSYHYLPEGKEVLPDGEESARLEELLTARSYSWCKGGVWSTDAIFRETGGEVDFYLSQGVRAVDMEGAGLFACARRRGVSMASLFVISDLLTREGWAPDFRHRNVGNTLLRLFKDIAQVD
ncbi:MAG: nucleoside phosphorylase [Spirochaetales bacterium]|nr:nucleoside phosphorylase [Spirochaetales bacterium]